MRNFTNDRIRIAYDLNNSALAAADSFGFVYINSAQTGSQATFFSGCTWMIHQRMMGRLTFDFDTRLIRTYYGLPFHHWAMIKFQYFIFGQWRG